VKLVLPRTPIQQVASILATEDVVAISSQESILALASVKPVLPQTPI